MAVRHFANTFAPWLEISLPESLEWGWFPVIFFFFFLRSPSASSLEIRALSPSSWRLRVLHSAWGWTRAWSMTSRELLRSAEVPSAAVCLTSSGGKYGWKYVKARFSQCGCSVLSPSYDSGHGDCLFTPGEVFPVCGCGTGRGMC